MTSSESQMTSALEQAQAMSAEIDVDYDNYWKEFKWRTDEKEKTIEFLNNSGKCDFSEVKSFLSIGAGEADVDFGVIKCSCPKLERYGFKSLYSHSMVFTIF